MRGRWRIRLLTPADQDYDAILSWSEEHFGHRQAKVYRDLLLSALDLLADGPAALGVRRRDDLRRGVMTLHITRGRSKGRHVIVFRVAPGSDDVVEVLRILHDVMDLKRHI